MDASRATPIAGVVVGPSPIHGLGCFAATPIAAGALIGTFTGPVVQQDGDHVLWAAVSEDRWEGRSGTSVLRFLNHADQPNAAFEGFDLYAIAVIGAGTEITIDYQP